MPKKNEKIIEAEVEEVKEVKEYEKSYFFPRALAYLIDMILIVIISSTLAAFVPTNKNYDKAYKDYAKIQDKLTSRKITVDEYMKEAISVVYDMDYNNVPSMIIQVTVLVLYFVVFQAINKGQTFGKKLMKIKIISTDGNELTMNQVAIRAIVINSVFINLLIIGAVMFSNRDMYYYISLGLQGFEGLIVVITLIMILFRNDGKGLHDLLAKTQVISC